MGYNIALVQTHFFFSLSFSFLKLERVLELMTFYSRCGLGNSQAIVTHPGGGHGNPLQYTCLENPHGQRNLEGCNSWGHKELDTTEQLSIAHST